MEKSQIAKWEKRIRYSLVTIFLLLIFLNFSFTDFNHKDQFDLYNSTILLIFLLFIGICDLIRFFSKNGNKHTRNIMTIAYSFIYLNVILLIIIVFFHLNETIGKFPIIFLFCCVNFLSLGIIERIIKKNEANNN